MKILFLDIDGVLNNFKERNFGEVFSANACACLNSLLSRVPDLQIVISSAWRMWGLEYMKAVLQKNGIDSERVIGVTDREEGIRGQQIQRWLDANPGVSAFVILDDETDMGDLRNNLIKTSMYVGLTDKEIDDAVQLLENQKE